MKMAKLSNGRDGKRQMTSETEDGNEDDKVIKWQRWQKANDMRTRTEQ